MADPEEIRGRMSEHLEECERCERDLPCEEWERLYAASARAAEPI
jgi:anti-sigma factor RsiW